MKIILTGRASNKNYSDLDPIWHGVNYELLDIVCETGFNPDKIKKDIPGLWRYMNFLPLHNHNNIISLSEGYTPIIDFLLPNNFLAKIKMDHLFPTGSYKDRGATVLISKARELGIKHLVQDSSGNAGASIAAYGAAANIICDIFLPEHTSEEKIIQIAAYGANIHKIPGNRKATAAATFEEAKKTYYGSHCYNPYFFQGTKTFAFEIAEQLGWKKPDSIVVPAGNGTLLIGIFLGLTELVQAGIYSDYPKIIAVQSELCNPLEMKSEDPTFNIEQFESGETLAEGIAIPNPVRIDQMLDCIKQTNGKIITVSENEIMSAWKWCVQKGHLIEPTSAATIAGLIKWTDERISGEPIVSLFTGSGLKSVEKIKKLLKLSQKLI